MSEARHGRFHALIDRVHDPLYRYLRRRAPVETADEVMSDILVTLWRRLDDIPTEGELPWCYTVARRALANDRRRRGRYLRLIEKLQSQPATDFVVDRAADFPELVSALETLTPLERELVTLWAWDGLEPREIAVVLNTTPNAISLRLARVRKKISREMDRQNLLVAGHKTDGHVGDQTDE